MLFQLAAGSPRLPPRSFRRSTDVVLSLYTCFSLYLPWRWKVRERSRSPVLLPVLPEGWDGAELRGSGPAPVRPCHSPWEFSLQALERSEAGARWAGQVRARRPWVFTGVPRQGSAWAAGAPLQRKPHCAVLMPTATDSDSPGLWESLLQLLSSGCFTGLAGHHPHRHCGNTKENKQNPPSQPPSAAAAGRGGSASRPDRPHCPLYTAEFPIKPSKSRPFYYSCCLFGCFSG